jgi:hypothetical protein
MQHEIYAYYSKLGSFGQSRGNKYMQEKTMRDLIKRINDFLDRDIREMIFKREVPQAPVALPQATEPTEIIAAPKTETPAPVAKKPRKKRQTKKV